jgi:hypothetical protein
MGDTSIPRLPQRHFGRGFNEVDTDEFDDDADDAAADEEDDDDGDDDDEEDDEIGTRKALNGTSVTRNFNWSDEKST